VIATNDVAKVLIYDDLKFVEHSSAEILPTMEAAINCRANSVQSHCDHEPPIISGCSQAILTACLIFCVTLQKYLPLFPTLFCGEVYLVWSTRAFWFGV